jgi:DNA-binding winged helix-turn-helix (wHTH) protein
VNVAVDEKIEASILFDLFELDSRSCQLRRSGVVVDLPRQALKVLALLTARPNQLVTRKEIKETLWPDEVHGDFDSRMNFTVKELREALGDNAERPRYVQTVRKAGYRFIAPIRLASTTATNLIPLPPALGPVPLISNDTASARIGSRGVIHPSGWRSLLLGFVLGTAALGLVQKLMGLHSRPVIDKVSAISSEQVQQIRIVGRGLGRHVPFTGVGLDTPYLMIGDDTSHWMAAKMDSDRVSDVTVFVQDWSDTLVTINGFSGMYGQGDPSQGNWKLHAGDKVRIRIWNPQHEDAGFGECIVIVGSGDSPCAK